MGIDDAQESRLLGRGLPGDDPTWGEVSAFLEVVGSAYAGLSATGSEGVHLAAVTREARAVRNGLHTHRRKTMKDIFSFKSHRFFVGAVIAALIALSGVGVASAMGGGPLAQFLPAGPVESSPAPAPTSVRPAPEPTASEQPDDQGEDEPTATPAPTKDEQDADDQGEDANDQGDDHQAASREDNDDKGEDGDDQGDDDQGSHSSKSGSGNHHGGDDEDQGGDGDNDNSDD